MKCITSTFLLQIYIFLKLDVYELLQAYKRWSNIQTEKLHTNYTCEHFEYDFVCMVSVNII